MEYDKGLMDIHFTRIQRPFNEGWFMGVNTLLISSLFDKLLEAQVVMGKLILFLHYLLQGIHLNAHEKFGL